MISRFARAKVAFSPFSIWRMAEDIRIPLGNATTPGLRVTMVAIAPRLGDWTTRTVWPGAKISASRGGVSWPLDGSGMTNSGLVRLYRFHGAAFTQIPRLSLVERIL